MPTKEAVQSAMERLEAANLEPTAQRLLDEVGGSKNKILELRNEVNEDRRRSTSEGRDLPPEMRDFAFQLVRSTRSHLETAYEASSELALRRAGRLADEVERLEALLTERLSDLKTLQKAQHDLEARNTELSQANDELAAEVTRLTEKHLIVEEGLSQAREDSLPPFPSEWFPVGEASPVAASPADSASRSESSDLGTSSNERLAEDNASRQADAAAATFDPSSLATEPTACLDRLQPDNPTSANQSFVGTAPVPTDADLRPSARDRMIASAPETDQIELEDVIAASVAVGDVSSLLHEEGKAAASALIMSAESAPVSKALVEGGFVGNAAGNDSETTADHLNATNIQTFTQLPRKERRPPVLPNFLREAPPLRQTRAWTDPYGTDRE